MNSFGKGPELYDLILTILPSLKYFHKSCNEDVPANEGFEINKNRNIKKILFKN
jgi:hypothetical protein